MNNKKRSIIIAGALILVMCLVIIILVMTDSGSAGNETSSTNIPPVASEPETANISLISRKDKLKKMHIKNQEDEFTVFIDKNGDYRFEENDKIEVYSGFMDYLWETGTKLGADQEVNKKDDGKMASDSELGLEPVQSLVTYTYEDGTQNILRIGNLVPGETNVFFISFNDDPKRYVAPLHLGFTKDMRNFCSTTVVAPEVMENGAYSDDVTIDNISVTNKKLGKTVKLSSNKDVDNASSIFYKCDYLITSQTPNVAADNNALNTLIYQLKTINANNVTSINPSDKQKKEYGFDNPTATISYDFNGEKVTINAGKVEDYYVYLMREGMNVIYKAEIANVNSWTDITYLKLRSALLFSRYINTVKSLTVITPDKTLNFDVERKAKENDADYYDYTVKSGTKSIELRNYQTFFAVAMGTSAIDYGVPDDVTASPELTIKFTYFDEDRPAETVTFTPVGTRRYLCKINGAGDGIVSSTAVEKIISDAQKLYNGEKIIT